MKFNKIFQKFLIVFTTSIFSITIFSCSAPINNGDYQMLFDGKTFDGWHPRGDNQNAWSYENGVILMTQYNEGRGWLEYDEPFKDFVFTCEWKVDKSANSGVFLRVPKGDGIDPTWDAIEIQISDDYNYPIFYHKDDPRELSSAIYGIVAPAKSMYKGIGEWNKFVITCKGTNIQLEYNGEKVMDINTQDYPDKFDSWKKERASLASRPGEGYIGLQSHKGSRVWFRNVGIKRLD